MDAFDLLKDRYVAQQRFRREVQEELGLLYMAEVKTNCKKECKASEDRTHCVSCLRTMEEIIMAGKKNVRD